MEQNEKLQEEKEDVQVKLAQINGKLQRYQNNEEQQGLSDESLTGNNSAGERSKVSPKLRFSTPLARHSICMELKDRLNEDKTLPSPFCEKLELSTDVNIINRRSVLLPTYMSAWDFEVSNGSLQDYSLELLKNRKSLSPSLYDADFEKKLNSLKDLEKDGLQKEIVKLYRANLDLAEKCHKSELNEVELREAFNTTNYKLEADRDKRQQLEESLESNRAAREVDLKDLWRLVHNPDEEDSTESEISLSSSAEYLKYQIRQEISALRNKLNIKEKALSALRLEKSKVHPSCKKRTTNSPLVEALNIDVVKSIKRQGISKGDKCSCECDNKVHTCNRSVPLMRKHSSEDNSDGQQFSHGDSLLDDQENLTSENSDANVDIIDNSEELDNMHRKDIPVRFRSDNSTGSECMLSNNSDTEGGVINNNHPKCQISKTGSGEKIQSNGNGEWQFIKDRDWGESEKGIEFKRPGTENAVVHKDKGHAMLRRQSYRKAIENPASSTDEMPTGRVRSDSFSNAIEEGQISPTSFSTTPVFSVSDTTPEYEGFESFSMTSAPRYFSTPLSIDTVKPVPIDRKTVCVNDNGTSCKDDESKPKIPTLQAQLFKAGGVNSNNSNHLSILLEEEAHGDQSSLCSHSSPSGLTSPSESGNSKMDNSGQEKSQLSEYDFSAEIWTLSRSSENSTNTPSSCDSGHSSSITSFEKANRSPSEDNKMYHSNENSSKTPPPSGSPVFHSTSVSTHESPISFLDYTSSYNASVSPHEVLDIKKDREENNGKASDINCNSVKPFHATVTTNSTTVPASDCKLDNGKALSSDKPVDIIDNVTDKCKVAVDLNKEGSKNYVSAGFEPNSQACTPSEKSDKKVEKDTVNVNKSSEVRFVLSPKRPQTSNSYESERNLAPSERILQRSAANKLANSPENKQNITNHVHLQNRSTTADPASVESKEVNIDDTESKNKMGLTVTVTSPVKEDQDCSDTSQPPSPAICFFKIGSNGMKKNTDVVPTKQPVTNGLDKSQVLVPGEGQDGSGGEHHKHSSNLSKIRENHLAKRRDYIKQNKMPELSELSEKDSPDNNNEEKAETVIKTKDDTPSCEINGDVIMPSIPNEFLQKLGLTQDGKSSEELSDQEIESKFTSLSLAFKTDSQTLEKRLEIQERSRDIAEQNVDKELQGLRIGLETLNQICTDPQVREVLTKIQNHIDILEKSTARVSSRAEVFGAIQQEKRMSKAVDIMVHHVENIRRVHEREHAELEEARKLLQDSRSLAPSTIDLPGGEMLSRRSASVCQNSMFGGKASRRRVSEIALPKVLGGTGAATLHPSASMGNMHTAHITSESNSLNPNFEADARSRFQAVIASTTVKTAVANTLRRASLEKQNHVQHVTPANTPQVSRDNSSDSPNKHIDVQDKEKQKNLEEEAFKKGYEQGMRASLGQDLSSLREQQNNINESLGEIMDSIDNQIEEPKSLKELLTERFHEAVPKIKISGWRIRMTMGCFFIVMAVLSVIISLFPASSASLIDYRHYGRPPL
ncbi:uncharacterized protein LOC132732834 isoform X2 [Ruditapes philippinarum]|uniref:uncharacterized protein LOC132732834 isoform X2 n=1 Tax=Ruditapes philippinarum TaxID=129788 RepID=UPI00295BA288|nr:uncharacterized protein LOC132732834 isoform X2 [Ruditapes philippinarum]